MKKLYKKNEMTLTLILISVYVLSLSMAPSINEAFIYFG